MLLVLHTALPPGGLPSVPRLFPCASFRASGAAQVPDTTRAPRSDTLAAEGRPLERPPLPEAHPAWGAPVTETSLVRTSAPNVVDLLAETPGTFKYDLGTAGWPHGWSYQGLSPQRPHLTLNGHPLTDPLTDRPRFDLLPLPFLAAPRLGLGPQGHAVSIHTQIRSYDVKHPLTELRFRRNSNGLQSIGVAHAQQRRIGLGGQPGLFQLVLGFFGRGSDGAYPNSDIRRGRRLYGRLRYRQARWSVALSNLHARQRIGAHGGILPTGSNFLTVYNPALATVRNPNARRQTLRNDLTLTARGPLVSRLESPLTASVRWTDQTVRAFNQVDTLGAQITSYSAFLRQDATWGSHHVTAKLSGMLDRFTSGDALASLPGDRYRLHGAVRDSVRWSHTDLVLDAGWHLDDARSYPSAGVHVRQRWSGLQLFATAAWTGQSVSWTEQYGFGELIRPLAAIPTGQILRGEAGLDAQLGIFDVRLTAFGHEVRDPIELFAPAQGDTLEARALDTALRRAGVTGRLGWRRSAERGLYASMQATAMQVLNEDASIDHQRIGSTLPEVFGQGRIGARFVLFKGDLDTDLSVGGRVWSEMRSRQFHGPTALWAVPPPGVPIQPEWPTVFGPSGTLNVQADVGFRGATLFFAFDNVLGGTNLQAGTFVVPVYPLPERLFRFGVFWPIEN